MEGTNQGDRIEVILGVGQLLPEVYQRLLKITTPLTELLMKDKRWDWSPKCQSAFDEIKLAMISDPVLVLPYHTKPFEVFTDTSDVAIGGFIVFIDNVANNYFFTQKKFSPKQARWQEFLAEFDFSMEYKPGKVNCVADGLSRRVVLLATHSEDVQTYVKTYLVYQQDKIKANKPTRILQPLLILERPWESIFMDFIIGLPKTDGLSSIMVVVDRFSKYATFIPASKVCSTVEAARLFLKHVVKYWGMPKTIINNRDTRFTGRFWTELFKLMGSSLNFSTAIHP
ncbi:hypothetical protein F3Y22_tig00002193pilonHSYRG00042 [Hibiscus syriacus]|uniref:Integrase catalytic domain-containing protein n=1 Tax=Hibiscus syriacus TaxID=106335 RepID=A0A6A3CYP8_HIBSY|nr:hypothetical protein F3Y22_tig00002193pilonHSYRG00042 [Hibiscus syriacus]